jgi:hypothetical protein
MGWDRMGWDRMGWDGMEGNGSDWNGTERSGMGERNERHGTDNWDRIEHNGISRNYIKCLLQNFTEKKGE